jgi:phosphatidylserine decarboxylase
VPLDLIPQYLDRRTGKMTEERVAHLKVQHWIVRSKLVRNVLNVLFNRRWYCSLYGKWVDRKASQKNIKKFIETFHIDLNDIEKPVDQYPNLNAFFSRKLKPKSRPFVQDASIFCSPADGKVFVYPQLDERTLLPIKGSHVNIEALLASESDARPFHGGAACIVRLAPYDYHRFHFPTDGQASPPKDIRGRYYLVNQLALVLKPDLFAHNKRAVTYIETETFGRFAYIEVSGFAVGRIIQTHTPGAVKCGQEKGYFQFGGSTLVLLFEPDKVNFDQDLITHTQANLEVQVQTGTQIGVQRI